MPPQNSPHVLGPVCRKDSAPNSSCSEWAREFVLAATFQDPIVAGVRADRGEFGYRVAGGDWMEAEGELELLWIWRHTSGHVDAVSNQEEGG
jgi:hypothetical protein